MITVHHLENSRSQRLLWMLEELGLEYEVKRYARDKTTMLAPAALKAVHPLGKSPVITDGGHVIAESGAINEYLLDRYGEPIFVPKTDDAAEGDGWILTVVWRGNEGRSDLAVFEATDIAKGPVALAHLSSRVPAGFHGNWRPGTF